MEVLSALLQLIVLATVVQFLTDIIKGWLPEIVLKYITPVIISAIVGISIAVMFGIDFFGMIGYVTEYLIFAQILTGIILSAGSAAIHELIAKLRESRETI